MASEETQPTKRLARTIKTAAPCVKRCRASIDLARVEPHTPPRLRSSSPHTPERRRARSLDRRHPENVKHSTQSSLICFPRKPSPAQKDTAITSPARVCIRACVTDVPGDPLDRTATLGREFCSKTLDRPFQPMLRLSGYDHGHIPPSFDSPDPVSVWIVYDLNVTSEFNKEQLNNIPHYVYLVSRQRTGELEFISRESWIEKARKRAKMYTWGGRQEQDELREMRNG